MIECKCPLLVKLFLTSLLILLCAWQKVSSPGLLYFIWWLNLSLSLCVIGSECFLHAWFLWCSNLFIYLHLIGCEFPSLSCCLWCPDLSLLCLTASEYPSLTWFFLVTWLIPLLYLTVQVGKQPLLAQFLLALTNPLLYAWQFVSAPHLLSLF
jgi:hypothetical protein